MNDNMPTKTGWFILVTILAWAFWELYVIFFTNELTISEQVWQITDRSIGFTGAVFFILGHFFWGRRS